MYPTAKPVLTLLEVDPRKLQVNPANVRKKTVGLDELAASIAKIGVQVPLIVRTNGSADSFVIVAGERRALAAMKAGVATVPVIVRSDVAGGEAELTAMLVENLHREGLTPADEAKGYEQLAAFGVTIDEIAQLTGRDFKRVTSGLAVAKSPVATEIAAKHPLSFDQVVAIAEFEGDEKAIAELVEIAKEEPADFDHTVEDLRRERDRHAARAQWRDRLEQAGVAVLAADSRFGWDIGSKTGTRLDQLLGANGKQLTPAAHKKCPGHAAEIDHWGKDVQYGCLDPKKHGHKSRYSDRNDANATSKAPKTAADKQAAAASKLQAEQDAQALASSTLVRRKFVRELLARKTPPQGLLGFAVPALVEHALYPDDPQIAGDLTGIQQPEKQFDTEPLFAELVKGATDARLQVVLLAYVVTSIEATWESSSLTPLQRADVPSAKYLQYLASCGYGLSDVEKKIVAAAFPKKSKAK